jgi:hypothetical protein
MPPPKFRCLTDAEAIPQIPQGPDAGNKWAQLERSRAETPARVQVLRDGNGNTRPELVAQGKADDELVEPLCQVRGLPTWPYAVHALADTQRLWKEHGPTPISGVLHWPATARSGFRPGQLRCSE